MEYIKKFIGLFTDNSYINFLSFLFGLGGIIFTIYFYIKGKKVKKPVYMIRTINLVREKIKKIDKINILYNGNSINDLSITKIAFWNEGKETIDNNDIAKNDPLRLSISNDYMFLDAKIIYQKNTANDFKILMSQDHKYIDINFDYFDFEEGIVLQIIHTGNKNNDISLNGKIKSVKNIRRKESKHSISHSIMTSTKTWKNRRKFKSIIGCLFIIIGLLLIIGSIIPSFMRYLLFVPDYRYSTLLIIYVWLISILYLLLGVSYVKRNIPKGFDIFNDEF